MSTVTEASLRLVQSRARLQHAIRDQVRAHTSDTSPLVAATALAWMGSLSRIPGMDLLLKSVQTWWAQHPLRQPTAIAWDAAKAAAQPLVQRHPAVLVAGAVALGGLLAWSRPWRWAFKPALLAALLPHIITSLLALRVTPPVPAAAESESS
jgi:hypothetical protein